MTGYKSDKAPVSKPGKLFEHWCDAKDCKEWGTFGYKTAYGQLWFCMAHRQEGEDALAGRRK
jgi:hypothetical protein